MTRPSKPAHALRRVAGNLTGATTAAADRVTAWYVMRPVKWSYLSTNELRAVVDQQAAAYAHLAGHRIHLRVSSAEYPVEAWAAALDGDTPNPVNPPAWYKYVANTQAVLRDRPLTEPVVFVGVDVGKQRTVDRVRASRRDKAAAAAATQARLDEELTQVTAALAQVAAPATQLELEWLTHRSIGLCLPAPPPAPGAGAEPLDTSNLAGVFDTIEVDPAARPFARSLRVVATTGRNSVDEVDRHVVVMSVGRMERQDIPAAVGPWLARLVEFAGVEISVHGDIQTGEKAAAEVGRKIDKLFDERRQYVDRGLHIPPNKGVVLAQAVQVQDVMSNAWDADAVSFKGHIRVAVDGATAREALERAEALRLHMRRQRIDLQIMRCQEAAAREFIPGETRSTTEYTRWMPARLFAAGVPQKTTGVGDGRGLRLGWSGDRPFTWNLHAALEANFSGVTPVIGDQGCGKSRLMGGIAGLATLQGIYVTAVDPPGTMAPVTKWEPIAGHSAVLDVMATEFSPYAVFPERATKDFYDHDDAAGLTGRDLEAKAWELARDAENDAKFERYQLTLDCLRAVLPHGLATSGETELLLSEAIRANNGCRADSTVKGVLRELRHAADKSGDRHAQRLADTLEHIAELPRARNWMLAGPSASSLVDARLLVMTMAGLTMPTGADPAGWQTAERLCVPLLALAMHYAYARVYRRPRTEPKVVIFDEAHYLKDWPSVRALLAKLERESRKLTIRAFLGSQDSRSALLAQDASKSLIYDAIVGQVSDVDDQVRCAELLHIDPGFAPELGRMRRTADARFFLMRINGQVGEVQPTLDEVPDLAALLDTTPTQKTARDLALNEEGWFR